MVFQKSARCLPCTYPAVPSDLCRNSCRKCCNPCIPILEKPEKLQGVMVGIPVKPKVVVIKPINDCESELDWNIKDSGTIKYKPGNDYRQNNGTHKPKPDFEGGICCCKAPCLLLSSLLRNLNYTETALKKRRLNCILFHELCTMLGADPCDVNDEKRSEALELAEKFGGWIEDLLERKGTVMCDNVKLDLKGKGTFNDLCNCTCRKPKKKMKNNKKKKKIQ